MQKINLEFFYDYDVDVDNRVRNVFWANASCKGSSFFVRSHVKKHPGAFQHLVIVVELNHFYHKFAILPLFDSNICLAANPF